ncbi:MAG: DUF4974 domain-containing protein [Bacteroidetes bacterium]|nr:MAG: DUF4974 domain-containing protein [Bacteroidota bacterium]
MNNNNIYTTFSEDTARYLSEEMNTLQKADFEKRLKEDTHLQNEFLLMKELWESMGEAIDENAPEPDTDKAWNRFAHRLEEQDNKTSDRRIRVLSFPHWLKWAAMLIVVAGLASYIALHTRQGEPERLAFSNNEVQLTMVKTLEDGSLIYLTELSTVEFDQSFNQSERNVFLSGEGYFDVTHNPEKPFKVRTNLASIEVIGTSFNVKMIGDNQMELFVESGRVKVSSLKGGKSLMLGAGELLVSKNGKMEKFYSEDYDTYWRKNLIHFKDEKLENILYVLSRTYGTLLVSDEKLSQRRMTLTIYDSEVQTICQSIALSLSAEYEWKEDSTVVFKSRD